MRGPPSTPGQRKPCSALGQKARQVLDQHIDPVRDVAVARQHSVNAQRRRFKVLQELDHLTNADRAQRPLLWGNALCVTIGAVPDREETTWTCAAPSVTLQVTNFLAMPHPMMKKPALGANAFTTIKRTEFNAGKFAPYVGDEVRIDIAIEAVAP